MSDPCRVPGCEAPGPFRVSSREDPWPLRYACAAHLSVVCLSMGERCGVDYIPPGRVTPPPRETTVIITDHPSPGKDSFIHHVDNQPVQAWADEHIYDILGGW